MYAWPTLNHTNLQVPVTTMVLLTPASLSAARMIVEPLPRKARGCTL